MSFDQIVDEVKKLSRDEQLQLIAIIDDETLPIDPEIEREHLAIIEERMKTPGNLIPVDEVLSRARKLLDEL